MTFEDDVIKSTVNKLLNGQDYRDEVVNHINAKFFDFTVEFFKKIVDAKINNTSINMEWYKKYFLDDGIFSTDDIAIHSGLNKKTISNTYKTAKKDIVLDAANQNFDYLVKLLNEMESSINDGLDINIKICHNTVSVDLNLAESLLVVNTLATKKMQIRGGAWSAIGKKVEKPLVNKLCELSGVPLPNLDNSTFHKDEEKDFDREIDYKLISRDGKVYNVEVKLMGKGNPESADATIARDSKVFIADTLSDQNKKQLKSLHIEYLELKDNANILSDFKKILKKLDVPHTED